MTDEEFMEHMRQQVADFDEITDRFRSLYEKIEALETKLEELD